MKTITVTVSIIATADDQRNYNDRYHRALTEAEIRNRVKELWDRERLSLRSKSDRT